MISLVMRALRSPRKVIEHLRMARYSIFWQVHFGRMRLRNSHPPGILADIEAKALWMLARRIPSSQAIVEVGSYLGRSTSFLADGAQDGTTVYAVDTWMCEAMAGMETARDVFAEFFKNTSPWQHCIRAVRAKSMDAAKDWKGPPIGLLFIDGDHSYEGVRDDISCWLPKLRRGAWVAFHDFPNPSFGVKRAVTEMVAPKCSEQLRFSSLWVGRIKG